jgi:hypothetical protein
MISEAIIQGKPLWEGIKLRYEAGWKTFAPPSIQSFIPGYIVRPANPPNFHLHGHHHRDWCRTLSLAGRLELTGLGLLRGRYLDDHWIWRPEPNHTGHQGYHHILWTQRHRLDPDVVRYHPHPAGLRS